MVNKITFTEVNDFIDYFVEFDSVHNSLLTTVEFYSEHSFYIQVLLFDIVEMDFTGEVLLVSLNGKRCVQLLVSDEFKINVFEDFEWE